MSMLSKRDPFKKVEEAARVRYVRLRETGLICFCAQNYSILCHVDHVRTDHPPLYNAVPSRLSLFRNDH